MKLPTITNDLIDPANKLLYRVMAYRALSDEERLEVVLAHLRTNEPAAPGKMITLFSTLGYQE